MKQPLQALPDWLPLAYSDGKQARWEGRHPNGQPIVAVMCNGWFGVYAGQRDDDPDEMIGDASRLVTLVRCRSRRTAEWELRRALVSAGPMMFGGLAGHPTSPVRGFHGSAGKQLQLRPLQWWLVAGIAWLVGFVVGSAVWGLIHLPRF